MLGVITALIVIAGLYFAKDLFIPFALALLLTFLLSAPVTWFERAHIRPPFSVLVVLVTTLVLAGGLMWLGLQQLNGIAESFPQYRAHIVGKLQTLRNPAGTSLLTFAENVEQLTQELTTDRTSGSETVESSAEPLRKPQRRNASPVRVEIVKPNSGLLSSLGLVSTSLLHYLSLLAAVVVLTLFMLLNRRHLRNRLLRLFGQGHLVLMTTALDEAAQKVSRYLLTQSCVNACFGTLLGIGVSAIGVPYAPFWGVSAAFLRFIPYIGTFMAGMCPVVLALATFDGWSKPLLCLTLFVAIEAVMSGAIEPWLYATRTGVSPLAILISAAFWTLLWGPIGLLLATPLTVCLAVLGRHLPPLSFLNVLLGDEPVLTPEVCYYQRLLAMDEEEATDLAESYLKEKTRVDLYDDLLIPALGLAEQDRHSNRLEERRVQFLYRSTRELLDELAQRATPDTAASTSPSALCIPVRDEADELVAMMLAQSLREAGWNAVHWTLDRVPDLPEAFAQKPPEVVILSALPPSALLPARALCRQLRRFRPKIKIVLGIWNVGGSAEKIKERLGPECTDFIVTSIREAIDQLQTHLLPSGPIPTSVPIPEQLADPAQVSR